MTIETNPGPKPVKCPICLCTINDRKETSVWCVYGGWVHLTCPNLVSEKQIHKDFMCEKCSWCGLNRETHTTTCAEPHAHANENLASAAAPQERDATAYSDISETADEDLALAAAPQKQIAPTVTTATTNLGKTSFAERLFGLYRL